MHTQIKANGLEALPSSKSSAGPQHYGRYILLLLIFAVVAYCLPFAFIRRPAFEPYFGSEYGQDLDFAFHPPSASADIVIFGDSSAFYGINPLQMKAVLGLNVLNLPNTGGSLLVTDDLALRRYVATHTPPRLIIFYFAPWNLNYRNVSVDSHLFEGEEMLLRNADLRDIWKFFKAHPAMLLEFPFQDYRSAIIPSLRLLLHHKDRAAEISAKMGHVDFQLGKRHHLSSDCSFPSRITPAPGNETLHRLVKDYTSPATNALIFLAPVPTCSNVGVFLDRSYSDVPAMPPGTMAPPSYIDDDSYIHLDAHSVHDATSALITAVRFALSRQKE